MSLQYMITRSLSTTACTLSRQIKRKPTRIPSDTHVYQEEVDDGAMSSNDKPLLTLVNRNPRNLELMSWEAKPLGFELETPSRVYWNKVTFHRDGKYLEGRITHSSGRIIVTASTKESAFKGQGLSGSDTDAAKYVGTILARRCLEAGIIHVHKELPEEISSRKVQTFIKTLEKEGLSLKEPEFIFPRMMKDL